MLVQWTLNRPRLSMGVCYFYCNLDKLEFFSIGVGGGALKHRGIGRGTAARLLVHLFVLPPVASERQLHWAGDRLAVLGDDHSVPTEIGLPLHFLQYESVGELLRAQFKDVSREALEMLLHLEPEELRAAAMTQYSVFEQLETLANGGDAMVETWLRQSFGKDWRKEYARRARERR